MKEEKKKKEKKLEKGIFISNENCIKLNEALGSVIVPVRFSSEIQKIANIIQELSVEHEKEV
jgi:hypothetical protein